MWVWLGVWSHKFTYGIILILKLSRMRVLLEVHPRGRSLKFLFKILYQMCCKLAMNYQTTWNEQTRTIHRVRVSTACGVLRARGSCNMSSLQKERRRAPGTAAAFASRASVQSSREPAALCSTAVCLAPARRASAMSGTAGRARRTYIRRGQTPRHICNVEHTPYVN